MTEPELRKLYVMVCDGKGYQANDGQFKVWKQTLGWCEEPDLAQGILWWMADNAAFPMPAELKPLAERAKRERLARAGVKRYLVMWQCRVCGHSRTGFLTMEERGARYCSSHWGPLLALDAPRVNGQRPERVQLPTGSVCGHEMTIVNDDRLATL
jgi:hypothetical protein